MERLTAEGTERSTVRKGKMGNGQRRREGKGNEGKMKGKGKDKRKKPNMDSREKMNRKTKK